MHQLTGDSEMLTARDALKIKSMDSQKIIECIELEIIKTRQANKYMFIFNCDDYNMDDETKKTVVNELLEAGYFVELMQPNHIDANTVLHWRIAIPYTL
jgi:hypothetical protein